MRAYLPGRNRLSYWQLPPHIERSLSSTPPGLLLVCRAPEKKDVGKRCTKSHVVSVHSRLEILPAVCMLRSARAAECGVSVRHSYVVNTHVHAHNTHTHIHTVAHTCTHAHIPTYSNTHTYTHTRTHHRSFHWGSGVALHTQKIDTHTHTYPHTLTHYESFPSTRCGKTMIVHTHIIVAHTHTHTHTQTQTHTHAHMHTQKTHART